MQTLLMYAIYGLVRLFHFTYRFEFIGEQHIANARLKGRGSYLLATWHQNLFGGILAQTGTPHVVIVSRSRDGNPVAFMCEKLGHRAARGSSRRGTVDKGGKQAKDEMIEVLKTGVPGAVTIDGPKGPAHEVKPGIVEMARLAQVQIVPYAPIAERYWRFNSWDQFRLPKPFSRILVYYGEPIPVPADTSFENFAIYQTKIAQQLHALEQIAVKP